LSNYTTTHFIGGTFLIGLGRISTVLLGLASTVLVVRLVPEADFGIFVILLVIAAFLRDVSSLGIHISTAKFLASADDKQQRDKLINTVILIRILTIILVSIATLIARSAISTLFGINLFSSVLLFVPLLFFLHSMRQLTSFILEGCFLFRGVAIADFIESFLNFVLIMILVFWLDQGILGLIWANAISLGAASTFAFISSPVSLKPEIDLGMLKKILKFGFPLQINSIMAFVFLRIDTLMIGVLLGTTQIAYYEIARKIPESLTGLYESFRVVMFPSVSRLFALGDREQVTKLLNHSFRLISFIVLFVTLISLVFGNEIISLLFSERYLPSTSTLVLLMICLDITLVNYTLGYSLVAIGDSDKPMLVNIVHVLISLLGNMVLIPPLGIIGAALAKLLGFSGKIPLNMFFLRRRDIHVKVWAYVKPLLIFSACWLVFVLFGPKIFIFKSLILLLFILFCVFSSVITKEDLIVISNEIKKAFYEAMHKVRSGRVVA
jgi:O-antigen/teichoic acid export membrane protein